MPGIPQTRIAEKETCTMPLAVLDGPTIKAGESLSNGLDCSSGDIVRITIPQEYTPANLTFQVSTDGNFYNDLFTSKGEEITVVAKPSTGIIIHEAWARSINFLKFRSGSRDLGKTRLLADQANSKKPNK
jgi:hypothetical protein